ncbi:unnamed protein product [Rhodiola kirilowii]
MRRSHHLRHRRLPHFPLLVAAAFTLCLVILSFSILSKSPPLPANAEIHALVLPLISSTRFESPVDNSTGLYHDWELFEADYNDMVRNLRIYVYPDVFGNVSSRVSFASIFVPVGNPEDPKLGNYYSEHMFKLALMNSNLVTFRPEEAQLFFLPFSINALRNDPRVRSEEAIAEFVAEYVGDVRREFGFWNASGGADHFFVCCHSVGRDASSKHYELRNNAIQVTCSSSYFQRLYAAHKDIGLPQVWPRPFEKDLNPHHARHRLVFFSGRTQNSDIRRQLIALWGNDTDLDIFEKAPPFSYEEGFRRSKYCLHVKGYEVNTARLSDAIHYGCVPVILSNYYDLPFANIFDWNKFSVIINHNQVIDLKKILLAIPEDVYLTMYNNLCLVRRHFRWHHVPKAFDSFYMTAYQLWLKGNTQQLTLRTSK